MAVRSNLPSTFHPFLSRTTLKSSEPAVWGRLYTLNPRFHFPLSRFDSSAFWRHSRLGNRCPRGFLSYTQFQLFFFTFVCRPPTPSLHRQTMEWQPQPEPLRQLACCLRDSLNPYNKTAQKQAEQVSFSPNVRARASLPRFLTTACGHLNVWRRIMWTNLYSRSYRC